MSAFYPELESYNQLLLDVDPRHRLYVEECGNPEGRPVLFIHGGPGATDRRFFDPARYRIVCPFDNARPLYQRLKSSELVINESAGHASVEAGTRDHLIAAIQKLLGF